VGDWGPTNQGCGRLGVKKSGRWEIEVKLWMWEVWVSNIVRSRFCLVKLDQFFSVTLTITK
jgi:hypothetical protein